MWSAEEILGDWGAVGGKPMILIEVSNAVSGNEVVLIYNLLPMRLRVKSAEHGVTAGMAVHQKSLLIQG
jgi:hypothetical protein